ncbi:MAG: glycosyltransferase family 1 protein [Acidobacteria bacterium]|nr:MAG: glycosyltransferase family 1 protein [Acidobacteriota bacterium]
MIEGHDIICFSNDWDSDPLSKKHIMQRLAKRNRVLWINSIGNRNPTASVRDLKRAVKKLRDFSKGSKSINESIHVYSPIAIPFHGNPLARWINRRILQWSVRRVCRRLRFENAVTWTFEPTSADIAGSLGEQAVVYHCVDEFSEFSGTDKLALLELERRLIEKSDCVFVSSDRLLANKRQYNPRTFLVTHGVDVGHFRKACDSETILPEEMKTLERPAIGFFGLIADWVDLELIRFLAASEPDWNFVLIGKHVTDVRIVDRVKNIHLLGPRPYALLPSYAKAFDAAMLPFVVNDLTLAANPLKLREYLAAGLPVVASAIPEAEKLRGILRIGRNKLDFLHQLRTIVKSGITGPQLSISRQMETESWDEKVEQLSGIFASTVSADSMPEGATGRVKAQR